MGTTAPRSTARETNTAKPKGGVHTEEPDAPQERGMRRAIFLAELAEARELRKRVAPRRARAQELHARLLRTFRY